MRRLLILVLGAALLTLGAACGGDDGEQLSQEEFEEQGNEICERNNAELEKAFEDRFGDVQEDPPADEVEEFIDDDIVPIIEGQIEELGELNPPDEISEEFESLLEDAEGALDEVRDASGEEILGEASDPFADVNERAVELGLTACGE